MRVYLLVFGLVGGVLLTSGCTTGEQGMLRTSGAGAPAASASPSPTGPADREVLVAALTKVHAAPFRFAVSSNLPKGSTVEASGVFDPPGQLYDATIAVTGGERPRKSQRIVVGAQNYVKVDDEKTWVHLDMSRVKKESNSLIWFDLTDPTGLVKFTTMVRSAKRTGPTTFAGTYEASFAGGEEYLPVGAPSLWTIGGATQQFTATTDEQGQVLSLQVEFVSSDEPKLVMKTTFSAHGQPSGVKAPRSNVQEAAEFYYK